MSNLSSWTAYEGPNGGTYILYEGRKEMYFKGYQVDEETPVQFVGVYTLKWRPEWGEPEMMFARVEGEEAELLEAAPDLLNALKEIVSECEDSEFANLVPSTLMAVIDELAYPAIAKATGGNDE